MYKRFIFIVFFYILIFSGCSSDAIWTGQTYSGTITKESNNSWFTYWDTYNVYYAGTWLFELTSKDNVDIYLEGSNPATLQTTISSLHAKANSNSVTVYLSGMTEIDICVRSSDADWVNNGYKAGYSFTATLK